jgi:hypothetical protein
MKDTRETCLICFQDYLIKNTKEHQCPDTFCGACGEQYDPTTEQDENGFHLSEICGANDEMATVEEVLNATQELTPKGWTVSHEYPNCVGVNHPTFTSDEFVMFGDINGYFAFNDCLNVCGDMEELTDAKEIAKSFWQQIAKIYPNLVRGE